MIILFSSLLIVLFVLLSPLLPQAEVMYRAALQNSLELPHVEPAAYCNYAAFLFRFRKDAFSAQQLFAAGLRK